MLKKILPALPLLCMMLIGACLAFGVRDLSTAQTPVPQATVSRTLGWNAVVTNIDGTPAALTGYQMYRSKDNGTTFEKQMPTVASTVLTWTDANVPTGNICYEVAALNAVGESGRSNRVCFSMPSAVPNPPTSLSVSGSMATMNAPSKGKKK